MQRGCIINFNLIFDILILITSYIYMYLGTTSSMEVSLIVFGLTIVISDSIIFILMSKGLPASIRDLIFLTGDPTKIPTGTKIISQITSWLNMGLLIVIIVSMFSTGWSELMKGLALLWLVCFVFMEISIQTTYKKLK